MEQEMNQSMRDRRPHARRDSNGRRNFLGGLATGAAVLSAVRAASAAGNDGTAAGYAAAPAADGMKIVPPKPGEPVTFTLGLDRLPIKSTSGGWAREANARGLPLATGIAGAHLFMNPGGSREMHWHATAAEWAYILEGQCQVTVLEPDGTLDVANYGPGDLWFFARGHAHGIQTLGDNPCHAILTFDDGLFSERGTFGLSDWLSRYDAATVAHNFGVPESSVASFPHGETYINQGPVIPLESPQAREVNPLPPARSHRYRMMAQKPWRSFPGGTIHLASAHEFPASATMTGVVVRLKPGAMQELHWHPNANEWFYVARGRVRATLFGANKKMAIAELEAGDCGYAPMGWGHSIQALGPESAEIISTLDNGTYLDSSPSEWIAKAPRHLLENNLTTSATAFERFPKA